MIRPPAGVHPNAAVDGRVVWSDAGLTRQIHDLREVHRGHRPGPLRLRGAAVGGRGLFHGGNQRGRRGHRRLPCPAVHRPQQETHRRPGMRQRTRLEGFGNRPGRRLVLGPLQSRPLQQRRQGVRPASPGLPRRQSAVRRRRRIPRPVFAGVANRPEQEAPDGRGPRSQGVGRAGRRLRPLRRPASRAGGRMASRRPHGPGTPCRRAIPASDNYYPQGRRKGCRSSSSPSGISSAARSRRTRSFTRDWPSPNSNGSARVRTPASRPWTPP